MLDTYLFIWIINKWVNPSGGSKGPPHFEFSSRKFKVGAVMDHLKKWNAILMKCSKFSKVQKQNILKDTHWQRTGRAIWMLYMWFTFKNEMYLKIHIKKNRQSHLNVVRVIYFQKQNVFKDTHWKWARRAIWMFYMWFHFIKFICEDYLFLDAISSPST